MSTRPRLARLLVVLVLTAMASACGQDSAVDPAATPAQEPLKVGITYDRPLFGIETADGVEGFDVDLARAVADSLGRDVTFVEAQSGLRETLLQDGVVDMVVATYSITEQRDEVVDFAGPYFTAEQRMLVRAADGASFDTVADLSRRNLSICVVRGTTSEANVDDQVRRATILRAATWLECRAALVDGTTDVVTTDDAVLVGLAVSAPDDDLVVVGDAFSSERYGIGVAEGSALRCAINEALVTIVDDGTWQALYEANIGDALGPMRDAPAVDERGC